MRTLMALCLLFFLVGTVHADPLPSWQEGETKNAILTWLTSITSTDSADFIPVQDRIAVFDNDGTSWCERPGYGASDFQISLARSLAAEGVIDGEAMPFKAWFADDRTAVRKFGYRKAYQTLNAAFAGMPVAAYRDSARAWLGRTLHEDFKVPHTELYYLGMLELKDLLLANDFDVWIVTGAAQGFVRSYSEDVLGIPPGQVIGTWTQPVYHEIDGVGVLVRGDEQNYNGHENKPAAIETRIGKRPVFAAGNSNNDQPMMRWALSGDYRGLALWIHHDDEVREYQYDRGTEKIAGLVEEHDGAFKVSIKDDWVRVFGVEKP